MVNLFPALVIAGPPHSGKSVLSFLLSQNLREMGIAHYLLRAAPDGEGNWFHEGKSKWVYSLRQKEKGVFSAGFIKQISAIINARSLPLLVDVGGAPRGAQFNILKACTHSIILYKNDKDLAQWRDYCDDANLIPVAELFSLREGDEKIKKAQPFLSASIKNLDRRKAQTGISFGAVLERVSGIFYYRAKELEKVHTASAPYTPQLENDFAKKIGKTTSKHLWKASDLALLKEILPPKASFALYGRGPVWLTGFFSAHNSPAPFSVFDIRYGWINISTIEAKAEASLKYKASKKLGADWMDLSLPTQEVLPEDISIPIWEERGGLVLSGILPKWLYAVLTAFYAPKRAWIGIYEPRENRVIVIFSRVPSPTLGESIFLDEGIATEKE